MRFIQGEILRSVLLPISDIEKKIPDNNYEDDFEPEEEKATDKRPIVGLREDQSRVEGKTVSVDVEEKEKEAEKEGTLPEHRKVC